MKSVVIGSVLLLCGMIASEARAQETRPVYSEVITSARPANSSRGPAMVVHEVVPPPPPPAAKPEAKGKGQMPAKGKGKAAAPQSGAKQPNAQKPDAQQAGEQQPAGPEAPAPMVMSGEITYTEADATGPISTGNPAIDKIILEAAARHGVDPHLIVAVMRQESGFNPRARSHKGASGLMQLMPATARRLGVTNIWDPVQNINGGAKYLRFLLDTFDGDVTLALAGYNAGENAVIRNGYRVPPYRETRHYVKAITARYGRSKGDGRLTRRAAAANQPPAAMAFEGGSSKRLSNNY